MARRSMDRAGRDQTEVNGYSRPTASVSPSDEISNAKALLDAGTISAAEFDRIRSRVVR